MNRTQLIAEIGSRIQDTVPHDGELTEQDIENLNGVDLSVDNILDQLDEGDEGEEDEKEPA